MRRRLPAFPPALLAALLAVLLVCGGCSALTGGPTTFVASSEREALLVSWVRGSSDQLTGTIEAARSAAKGSSGPVASSSSAFTGTISGGAVSLQVGGQLGSLFGATITGSLYGDTLTLNVPARNGQVGTVDLVRASAEDYNQAVEHLQSVAEAQRAQAASAQASQDAQETLSAASSQLESDLKELKTNTAVLRSGADDLDSALDDIRTALAAQQQLARESRTAGCDDVPSVQSDESGAAADVDGASSDYDGAVSDYEAAVDATKTSGEKVDGGAATVRNGGGQLPDLGASSKAAAALKDAASVRSADDRAVKKLLATSSRVDDETQALSRC